MPSAGTLCSWARTTEIMIVMTSAVIIVIIVIIVVLVIIILIVLIVVIELSILGLAEDDVSLDEFNVLPPQALLPVDDTFCSRFYYYYYYYFY